MSKSLSPFFCPLVYLLKKSKALSALSCRLTQLTGKSKYPIHPKHLVLTEKPWYSNDLQASDLVLDLGCGNGQHSLRIAKKVKKVIAVDHNQEQLRIASQSAQDKKIKNIKFKKMDLEKKLPFKNKNFNKILALDIIEHLENRKQFLKEIKRVLKPKGLVFITFPHKETSWKKIQKKAGLNYYSDPDHKIEYSINQIRKIIKQSGFKTLSFKPIVYDTGWAGLIDFIGGISLNLYERLLLWKKNKVKDNFKESIGFRLKLKIF